MNWILFLDFPIRLYIQNFLFCLFYCLVVRMFLIGIQILETVLKMFVQNLDRLMC